jgi:hypothetical protein
MFHRLDQIGDGGLGILVEVRRALVEKEDARIAIERARQQHALPLPAGQRRAHVADEAEILHRHAHDVVVHLRQSGGGLHLRHVEVGIEESDIVGDGPGQQPVVLRDDADMRAPCPP